MMRKGDKGPLVIQLQRELLELGYALPRWGADGDLGDETLGAVEHFARDHGYPWTSAAPQIDQALNIAITTAATALRRAAESPGPAVIDRRATAARNKDGGPRAWGDVYGWCLHQTACVLSNSHDVARCDTIGAHYVVYPDGRIFKLHDINRVVWHGNGWNAKTIGIEIDGLFAGIEGVPSTVWRDPSEAAHTVNSVTDAQIAAVKAIVRADAIEIRAHGGKPRSMVAHRQSSGDRRNDPGSKVWQQIGIPLRDELGLDDGGPGFALRDGYGGMPIPTAWDRSRPGIDY